jgi:hypothetical protein
MEGKVEGESSIDEPVRPPTDAVNLVVDAISADVTHIHVRITAAVGLALVFVTQIPLDDLQDLSKKLQWLTVVGIFLLWVGAAFYFQYTQQLNKLRLRIVAEAANGMTGEPTYAKKWREDITNSRHHGGWTSRNVWYFRAGQILFLGGTACLAIVLVYLIPKH